jgi:hypothetical protein
VTNILEEAGYFWWKRSHRFHRVRCTVVRHEGNHDSELEDLTNKSEALSNLYHILLLRKIGIDDQELNTIAYRSIRSYGNPPSLMPVCSQRVL